MSLPSVTLAIDGKTRDAVRAHLFPGDGREAIGLLVCTRSSGFRLRLIARDFIAVPHAECTLRAPDRLSWPGAWLERAIERAMPSSLAVIPIHSHPGGLFGFSPADDASDQRTIRSLFAAGGDIHGSAIMISSGQIHARIYGPDLIPRPVDLVTVPGDDIEFWWDGRSPSVKPLAYTGEMRDVLARLTAAVVGVSGIGSIVAELLARIGFGRILLIDFDRVKKKNLDRIIHASADDAKRKRVKVEVVAEAIARYRGAGVAVPLPHRVGTRIAVAALGGADAIFSCPDRLQPRMIVDRAAAAFCVPLFDAGVSVSTRGTAGGGRAIADAAGRIDYIQPGRSTLADRSVYTPDDLQSEYLHDVAPDDYRDRVARGYIKGLPEGAPPSVITLNTRAASYLVEEFLARAFPSRIDGNAPYARTIFSLAGCDQDHYPDTYFPCAANPLLASGDSEPLLGLPSLGVIDLEAA